MKIAAVVVTFNRLDLLKKVIGGLRNQTRVPDKIIVVNNSSTDGTAEWLKENADLHVVTQPNWGSSGGQFTGSTEAHKLGYEYIWLMDDDVVARPDCLENMLKHADENRVVAPLRYMNGEAYKNDVIKYNMTDAFKSIWAKIISKEDFNQELIYAEGITFEGPMMHRSVFERIGFPEKDFFIYADDTEFFVRCLNNNIPCYVVRDANLDRMIPITQSEHIFTWKHYYVIRNIIAIDRLHGKGMVRNLRPIGYFIKWLMRAKSADNLKTVVKAFVDGWKYTQSKNPTVKL